jgi:hypothetical protein
LSPDFLVSSFPFSAILPFCPSPFSLLPSFCSSFPYIGHASLVSDSVFLGACVLVSFSSTSMIRDWNKLNSRKLLYIGHERNVPRLQRRK